MVHSKTQISGRQIGRQKRKPKGTVKVESDKGWLRLRFTYGGRRRAFALGLPDTGINQKFAEQKARQIELDILSGNFDSSLQKYKPQKTSEEIKANLDKIRSRQKIKKDYKLWILESLPKKFKSQRKNALVKKIYNYLKMPKSLMNLVTIVRNSFQKKQQRKIKQKVNH